MTSVRVVVGADGFVGGALAAGLDAVRVVYRKPRGEEVHIERAGPLLSKADVVVNAAGFRVRRGLDLEDYRKCHVVATASLTPYLRPGALLVHISSAHVLGRSRHRNPGNDSVPQPATYPCHEYAIAKYETDLFLEKAASLRDFRVVFLRPTILYAEQGDGSLIDNLLQLKKGGLGLRLYPRSSRHHFCHMSLLVEVAKRVVVTPLPQFSKLVVADPYTITSAELEKLLQRYFPASGITLPVPTSWLSPLLTRSFHSKNPKRDLATWGQILGVLHLDTEYDSGETFRLLDIDPEPYSMARTLLPLIEGALQSALPISQPMTARNPSRNGDSLVSPAHE
jgi:nucleoside-diphosphate-sugar epimerase